MKFPDLIRHGYEHLITAANSLQSPFLLLIRLFWGWQFIQTGWGKIFGKGIGEVAQFFGGIGIPFPYVNAWMAALTETVGGAFLLIGLASRLTAIPLIVTMIVALITTELDAIKGIFSDPDKFTGAAPFLFLLASLIILIFGPGAFSVDRLIERRRQTVVRD